MPCCRKSRKSPPKNNDSALESIARTQAMKKSAKSGNKQKQKEVNAEIEKLEKDLEERQQKELETNKEPEGEKAPAEDGQEPSVAPPAVEQKEDNEGEEEVAPGFYKQVNISSKKAKKQAQQREKEDKRRLAEKQDKDRRESEKAEGVKEKAAIKELLDKNRLKMVEIPGDGDCMYNAVIHQLQETSGIEVSLTKLRRLTAHYIRDHEEEYKPFVSEAEITDLSTVGKGTYWEKYLDGIERPAQVGGIWGGELEAKAISMIYKKPISIFRMDGGEHQIGDEFAGPKVKRLRIVYLEKTFTLGEHYNSTSPA